MKNKVKNKVKNKIRGKRRILVLATMLLIMGSSVTVFAAEKFGNYYGCDAKGYVHSMIVESGFGMHAGDVGVYLCGNEWDLLGKYPCGTQFGGTGVWDEVWGYEGEEHRKILKKEKGYFTYVNCWLQTDDGYIDAPEGY